MSAECEKCGSDLVYADEYPAMECPRCIKDARIAELEAMGTSESARLSQLLVTARARIADLEEDLAEESRQADEAVDSVVAKVKWYHEKLEEKDVTIKALRHLLAWPKRTQKAERRTP